MQNFEDILNAALEDLHRGSSVDEVVSKWPEQANELKGLLQIASDLQNIPTNTIPRPSRRRVYLQVPSKASIWQTWFHMSRFATASMASLLLVAALVGSTAYAAMQSLPGQNLFPVKKAIENTELAFATNNQEKAALQIKITQQRLAEAQEIFNSPDKNTAEELAAINELTTQTQAAAQAIGNLAVSSSVADQTPAAVASLQNITNQQQNLLAQVQSDPNTQVAQNASKASQQVKQVAQVLQVVAAASDESALANLTTTASSSPDSISVSGFVNQISVNKITVEKTTFLIASSTIFTDASSSATTTLPVLYQKVTVTGQQNTDGSITAQQITILPDIETAATSTPSDRPTSSPTSAKKVTTGISDTSPANLDSSSTDTSTPPANAGTAVGTFIPEDPSPQFAQ